MVLVLGVFLYQRSNPAPNTTLTHVAGKNSILITDKGFDPKYYTVSPGTGMTWINQDTKTHTLVFDKENINSGKMQPQDIFTHMFSTKGTYEYHCSEHSKEKGIIYVK